MSTTEKDDYLHAPPDDDRWWTETYWFSFDDPARRLSAHFYPLLRPNLDLAALQVQVWSPGRETPWTAPYYKLHWHLPAPRFEGRRLALDALAYEILEPMQRYRVTFDDPGVFSADLEFSGVAEPYAPRPPDAGGGHLDQPMRVTGVLELHGQRLDLDCHGMRDRSWGPRVDGARSHRALYTYGIRDDASFLVITLLGLDPPVSVGYLDRDGRRGRIVAAEVEREDDAQGRAERVVLRAQDEHGRRLEAAGVTRNRFAMQASPGQFSWIQMIDWNGGDAGEWIGEFQEVLGIDGVAEQVARDFAL